MLERKPVLSQSALSQVGHIDIALLEQLLHYLLASGLAHSQRDVAFEGTVFKLETARRIHGAVPGHIERRKRLNLDNLGAERSQHSCRQRQCYVKPELYDSHAFQRLFSHSCILPLRFCPALSMT